MQRSGNVAGLLLIREPEQHRHPRLHPRAQEMQEAGRRALHQRRRALRKRQTPPGFPDHFGFFLPLDVRRADVPVGKVNEKANEKAANDPPLAPHSPTGEDASVPRAVRSADVPVGQANEKAVNDAPLAPHSPTSKRPGESTLPLSSAFLSGLCAFAVKS